MTSGNTFTMIYQKLDEALSPTDDAHTTSPAEASASEIDEIDQLRRIVLEITEPEPVSYTTT